MKNLIIVISFLYSFQLIGQIHIAPNNTAANPAAMLEVSSNTKGLLLPRMTTANRLAISASTNGLIVFDTDTQNYWIAAKGIWQKFETGLLTSDYWLNNLGNLVLTNNNAYVGIGTNNPSKVLEINYTSPNDGVLVNSTSGYSVLNIDAFNGNASVKYSKNGTLHWEMGTKASTLSFNIFNKIGLNKNALIIDKTNNYASLDGNFPLNNFEIGPNAGFSGNNLVLGKDGTSKIMAIKLTPSTTIWKSNNHFSIPSATTDYNNKFLGIGTTNPYAPVHVATFTTLIGNGLPGGAGKFFNYASGPSFYQNLGNLLDTYNGAVGVSIFTEGSIITSTAFRSSQNFFTSDARIKNIIGLSDAKQDLDLLNKIEITNYTMKDKAQWGNKTFKKVIAQQVESVYPQAITKMNGVIPDIYEKAQNVKYNSKSKTISFELSKNFNLKAGEKLQVNHPQKGDILVEVLSTKNNIVTIKNWDKAIKNLFIFGREVDDLRSVDYDALSILGISALQQLDKEHDDLLARLKRCEARLEKIITN